MECIYPDEDQILVQKLSEGDEGSFNALYEKYSAEIYTNALHLLKNHAQAQDVTQEIFVSLWLNREKYRINNLRAYLHVAARNRILRIFEQRKRFVPFEVLISRLGGIIGDEPSDYLTAKHEFLQAYKNLLDSLPLRRRKIFDYYFEDGLSTEEIAGRLALSRKTVQNQLGRAVSFLKANLSHLSAFLQIFFH